MGEEVRYYLLLMASGMSTDEEISYFGIEISPSRMFRKKSL